MSSRERRVAALEAFYSIGAPTGCCQAPPSLDAFRAAHSERERIKQARPELTHAEIVTELQPTRCSRTGGPLCPDAVSYYATVRDRVARLERNTAGLFEDEL